MALNRQSEAYVVTMTFLLHTPGAYIQRVISDPEDDLPRPLLELLSRWRRAPDVCLSGDLMRTLADLDDNALFSVLNTCIARLVRKIVAEHESHPVPQSRR